MKENLPVPVVIGVVALVIAGVIGGGVWFSRQTPQAPPPVTAHNVARGVPPPMSAMSNAYHPK